MYEENIHNVTFYVLKKQLFFRKVFIDKQLKKPLLFFFFFKIYERYEKDFEKHVLRIVG